MPRQPLCTHRRPAQRDENAGGYAPRARCCAYTFRTVAVAPAVRGSALVAVLLLLALLVGIALGISGLAAITLRESEQELALMEARANARLAMMLALGDLQQLAGPDMRVTATADIAGTADWRRLEDGDELGNGLSISGNPRGLIAPVDGSRRWTGVWRNADDPDLIFTKTPCVERLGWLVSGTNPDPADAIWPKFSLDTNPGSLAGIYADCVVLTDDKLQAEQGYRHTGMPGWLTQADVLQVIGPALSTRSDTFRIRACGVSARKPAGQAVRVWCEAVVQRMPHYVDQADLPDVLPVDLSAVNQRFWRRFVIISFRWLARDDVSMTHAPEAPAQPHVRRLALDDGPSLPGLPPIVGESQRGLCNQARGCPVPHGGAGLPWLVGSESTSNLNELVSGGMSRMPQFLTCLLSPSLG